MQNQNKQMRAGLKSPTSQWPEKNYPRNTFGSQGVTSHGPASGTIPYLSLNIASLGRAARFWWTANAATSWWTAFAGATVARAITEPQLVNRTKTAWLARQRAGCVFFERRNTDESAQ